MNEPAATHNTPEYSVSEISGAIKQHIEDRFGYVRVRGEISGLKLASSGHAYYSLKDDKSVISAISWRGNLSKMKIKPEDGLEVIASGRVTTYPGRSNYQIIVENIQPAGAGALMALLEERKRKLEKEGLFDGRRKKKLPFLPKTIGVVTSPTGAVIRDILHRIEDRFGCHVLVWPVAVQGDGAAEQIAAAIEGFNALEPAPPLGGSRQDLVAGDAGRAVGGKNPAENNPSRIERANAELSAALPQGEGNIPRPDLIIVARGGGSIEDLWAFNEEVVVRAVAASNIPLISAVGHETDTTLIDYAADKRAPTPTAAAEMAVPVKAELELLVKEKELALRRLIQQLLEQRAMRLHALMRGMPKPQHLMEMAQQRLDSITGRLELALPNWLERKAQLLARLTAKLTPTLLLRDANHQQQKLVQLSERTTRAVKMLWKQKQDRLESQLRLLGSISHESVLKRGFALVKDADGKLVSSALSASEKERMQLQFADGLIDVRQEK